MWHLEICSFPHLIQPQMLSKCMQLTVIGRDRSINWLEAVSPKQFVAEENNPHIQEYNNAICQLHAQCHHDHATKQKATR